MNMIYKNFASLPHVPLELLPTYWQIHHVAKLNSGTFGVRFLIYEFCPPRELVCPSHEYDVSGCEHS